jgi:hypothetical protein
MFETILKNVNISPNFFFKKNIQKEILGQIYFLQKFNSYTNKPGRAT